MQRYSGFWKREEKRDVEGEEKPGVVSLVGTDDTITSMGDEMVEDIKEEQLDTEREEPDESIEESDEVEMTIEEKRENDLFDEGEMEHQTLENYDPTLDLSSYSLPPVSLLDEYDRFSR